MAVDWVGRDGARTARRYADMAAHVAPVSPSYEALCHGVASDEEVVARLDVLPAAKRQPNLLFGAVRWLGGPIDSYPAFRRFVLAEWDALAATMLVKRTQTNEPRRLATLLPALAELPQPLALLEVGASAGLCLYPDRYAYRYDGGPVLGDSSLVLDCATAGPVPLPQAVPTVAWRGGLDLNPLDLREPEDVRWLQSLIWPEQTERFDVLRAAVEIARREPVEVVQGDLTRDLVPLAARVPPGSTLVVYHSAVLAYVGDDGRRDFRAQLADLAASRPVVWLANEVPGVVVPPDSAPDAGPNEFVLARDGQPLALTESHGTRVRWLARAAEVVGAVLLLVALCSTPGLAAVPAASRLVFHLQDDRIDEASGIGVGIRSPGIDYVENDSGDVNRFFALNAKTGRTAAVVTVPHATNVDWEDLQVAPSASGVPSVWIADIGDNGADRSEIDVYRVPEPHVDPHADDLAVTAAAPAVWRLRYPDGPTDAESLAVTPQGRAYIITKDFLGESEVYRLPRHPDAERVRTLTHVATIDFPPTKGSSPVGSLGSVLATSAAVSPDGRLLAVRTYVYADVWRLQPHGRHDDVVAALRRTPTRVVLPRQPQGEGIAFRHDRLLIDSEHVGSAVWSVPLPRRLVQQHATTSATTATSASTSPSGSISPSGNATPSRTPQGNNHRSVGISAIVLILLLGSVVLLGRRARGTYGGHGRG